MAHSFSKEERVLLEALSQARGLVPIGPVEKMLRLAGYRLNRRKGLWRIYAKSDSGIFFTLPVHKFKVEAPYVRNAVKILFPEL